MLVNVSLGDVMVRDGCVHVGTADKGYGDPTRADEASRASIIIVAEYCIRDCVRAGSGVKGS